MQFYLKLVKYQIYNQILIKLISFDSENEPKTLLFYFEIKSTQTNIKWWSIAHFGGSTNQII